MLNNVVKCYWGQQCDCPEKTPNNLVCTEHSGYECGIWNGITVQKEEDVNDIVTTIVDRLERIYLPDDKQTIDDLKKPIDDILNLIIDRVHELEKLQADVESQSTTLTEAQIKSFVEASQQMMKNSMIRYHAYNEQRIQITKKDLDTIEWLDSLLITPYNAVSVPLCTCYINKKNFLDRLYFRRIGVRYGDLDELFRAQKTLDSQINEEGKEIIFKIIFSAVLFFIPFFGLKAAVGMLMSIIFNIRAIRRYENQMQLNALEIVDTKIELVKLMLSYYRHQNIGHCQPNPAPKTFDIEGFYQEKIKKTLSPNLLKRLSQIEKESESSKKDQEKQQVKE